MLPDRVAGPSNHSPPLFCFFFFCGGKQPLLPVWKPAAAEEEDDRKIIRYSVPVRKVREVGEVTSL